MTISTRLGAPTFGLLLAAAAVVAVSPPLLPSAEAQASPMKRLMGSWSGRGTARFEGNRSERIKCNAYYTGGGSKLNIAVRCASPSYKIEIRSKLTNESGRLVGTWEERTFNASGETRGSIDEKMLKLSINGGGLTASMAVDFDGSRQAINVMTDGMELKSVAIKLARSN